MFCPNPWVSVSLASCPLGRFSYSSQTSSCIFSTAGPASSSILPLLFTSQGGLMTSRVSSSPLLLRVWPTGQQLGHHWRACQKCRILGHPSSLLSQKCYLNRWFRSPLKFEKRWPRPLYISSFPPGARCQCSRSSYGNLRVGVHFLSQHEPFNRFILSKGIPGLVNSPLCILKRYHAHGCQAISTESWACFSCSGLCVFSMTWLQPSVGSK